MDGCKKYCEIKTVSLKCGLLQALPWNNDTIIEKMDGCKWCRQITNFFQYTNAWNQGGIRIILSIPFFENSCFAKKTVNLKEWMAAITLL